MALGSTCFGCSFALDTDDLEAKAAGVPGMSIEGLEPGTDEPDSGGGFTTALDTPAIELDFSGNRSTRDPCVITTTQASQILEQSCAPCHAPPASMGSFNSILDFPALITLRSNTTDDPETGERARLVVPGDPDASRLYRRVQAGEMPPQRMPPLRRPSTSDISILRTWIEVCLPKVDTRSVGDAGNSQ